MTARENLVVVEFSVSYDDGPWRFGVQILEFRDDRVTRERIYVMEGWDAPEWRAPWRSRRPPTRRSDPTGVIRADERPGPAGTLVEVRGFEPLTSAVRRQR